MIKPTVGRIVWYKPDPVSFFGNALPGEPLAAIITAVWREGLVNLAVFDSSGMVIPIGSVVLSQADFMDIPAQCCCWMPYQKGQAAKADELSQQVANLTGGGA